MLTTNVDVSDGLTNGSTAAVTNVIRDNAGNPHIILVQFECSAVGENARNSSPYKHISATSIPIHKGQATFMIRGHKSCQASRTQFPLTLAWAVTIHKCQGLTLPEIVVDMSPKKGRFSGGQHMLLLVVFVSCASCILSTIPVNRFEWQSMQKKKCIACARTPLCVHSTIFLH